MLVIKVSTPWNHIDFNTRLSKLVDKSDYVYDFSVGCNECDFWIIWGGIGANSEKVTCPPENVIYITDEVHELRTFNQSFLEQFAAILTYRTDIKHQQVIITEHELNTWLIDKDYDTLAANQLIKKSKKLSVVCSDLTWLPGHKSRFAFVNKLIGHFKDKIDVYGRGFNFVNDKYDALAPYKYSVAIENTSAHGYFTEKIADCYLTDTMPLYYGCPNIANYFDLNSFLSLDLSDFKKSIADIERLLEEDPYETLLPLLKIQKNKYLTDYHIFSKLPFILSRHFSFQVKRKAIIIKSEKLFGEGISFKSWIKQMTKIKII